VPAGVVSQPVGRLISRTAWVCATTTCPAPNETPHGRPTDTALPLPGPPTPPAIVEITPDPGPPPVTAPGTACRGTASARLPPAIATSARPAAAGNASRGTPLTLPIR